MQSKAFDEKISPVVMIDFEARITYQAYFFMSCTGGVLKWRVMVGKV